jgi:hypothetical protein
MESHERALIGLGYMEERIFVTRIPPEIVSALSIAFALEGTRRGKMIVEKPIARITDVGSDFVLRAARQDMAKWEARIEQVNGIARRRRVSK